MSTPIGSSRARFLCLLTVLTIGFLSASACTSKKLDPRCTLTAPYEYRGQIAQFINGSNLWEAFLDYRLNSITLSRIESEIVSALNSGDENRAIEIARESRLLPADGQPLKRNREREELEGKLAKLGCAIPWRSRC